MRITTKDEILKKFPLDSVCQVWYRNLDGHMAHGVTYKDGFKNVKWKHVWRIKIFFKESKKYRDKHGESIKRDSVVYFLMP